MPLDPSPVSQPSPSPVPGAQPITADSITYSRGLPEWLLTQTMSFAFTSYQLGQLYLVGVDADRRLALHQFGTGRAMGLWANPQTLVLATDIQVWRFENVLGPGQVTNLGADRHYVPRVGHITGDLDLHDVSVLGDGRIIVVNTAFSCLALLSNTHAFRVFWQPPFISKLAPEDRCHLNGLAVKDGEAAYVTATSRSDVVTGWRARRAEGGLVMDVKTNAIVTEKLSMPHSPRWHNGQLWVLNSGSGYLGTVDLISGAFEPKVFCPGFLRGLAFHGNFAFVGLSLPRDGAFTGLALDIELPKRDADPWCGVQIIDLNSGAIVQWLRIEGGVTELFDVAVLPGVRRPTATAPSDGELSSLITYEMG